MMYGLLALTGARAGEVVALAWGAYRNDRPLGRLSVHRSFNAKAKSFRPTKSEVPRQVPVHPVLAGLLADWRRRWAKEFGRAPTPKDLIMPWVPKLGDMEPWRTDTIWKRLQRDLDLLGLRPRRVHDFRRTFISLCRQDGARDDLLKWVTHGRPPGIMDVYTTPPWPALCAQMQALEMPAPHADGHGFERAADAEDAHGFEVPAPDADAYAQGSPGGEPSEAHLPNGDLQSDLQSSLQSPELVEMVEERGWSRRESNPRPKEDSSKALRA